MNEQAWRLFSGDFLGLNFSTYKNFVRLNLRILIYYFKSGSFGCFNLLEPNTLKDNPVGFSKQFEILQLKVNYLACMNSIVLGFLAFESLW